MNREIKFRAWNPDSKEMTYVPNNTNSYLHLGANSFLAKPKWFISNNGASCAYSDRSALMQFTGMHDRSGKEIYEGDIVRIKGTTRRKDVDGETGEILWYNAHGRWAIKLKSGVTAYYPFEKEIIGNIYENPALLSDKDVV